MDAIKNSVVTVVDRALEESSKIQERLSNGSRKAIDENSSVKDVEKAAREMVKAARGLGFHVAADNLEYFINRKDLPRIKFIDRNWLRSFAKVKEAERVNQIRFENDIFACIEQKKSYYNYKYDRLITYHNRCFSTEELFFASGDSTLTTKGSFSITINSENIRVKGVLDHRWHDPYDFHNGLGALIPGFGYIPDAAMNKLVTQGNAAEYLMECKWKQELDVSFDMGFFGVFGMIKNWEWRTTI